MTFQNSKFVDNTFCLFTYSLYYCFDQVIVCCPVQPSVAFYLEDSHLFCSAKQVTVFYKKQSVVFFNSFMTEIPSYRNQPTEFPVEISRLVSM